MKGKNLHSSRQEQPEVLGGHKVQTKKARFVHASTVTSTEHFMRSCILERYRDISVKGLGICCLHRLLYLPGTDMDSHSKNKEKERTWKITDPKSNRSCS